MPSLPLFTSPALRRLEQIHAAEPLMERAGLAAAEWASELATPGGAVLILAGPGNNGGDALVAARRLRERFFATVVVFAGDPERLPADARQAWDALLASGHPVLHDIPELGVNQHGGRWSLIVDGLFGIGLTRPVEGKQAELIDRANTLARHDGCPLLALDAPSGLNADTGTVLGSHVIRASHTLTFIAAKPGLFTADGPDHAGQVRVAELGLPVAQEASPCAHTLGRANFASSLKTRRLNSHKGSHGSVGILGGAPGMVGAALLAARAAVQLGAGRVFVGLRDEQALAVDPLRPEVMFRPAEDVPTLPVLTALAAGPGFGTDAAARTLLRHALAFPGPLLLDADALNLLAAYASLQQSLAERHALQHPTLLTPHPTEAARLLECDTATVQADRLEAARQLARRYHAQVALKGCGTVLAQPDGHCLINCNGNPGLATAGSGDVLAGMATALLAQGWPAEDALAGAVHLHGAAADALVAAGDGPIGIAADELPAPARRLLNQWISG